MSSQKKTFICAECEEEKEENRFYTFEPKPHCKDCIDGFWSTMGDDPCGKNWE